MSFLVRSGRLLPLLVLLSTAGCATLQDTSYEMTQHLRTETAFFGHWFSCETDCSWDYNRGWKAGYFDVLTGGDGAPPLIAPHSYWSPWQIIWHCDEKRQNWYMGFQDGALLASQQPDTHYLKLWSPAMTVAQACPPGGFEEVPMPMLGVPPEPTPIESSIPPVPSVSPEKPVPPAPSALPVKPVPSAPSVSPAPGASPVKPVPPVPSAVPIPSVTPPVPMPDPSPPKSARLLVPPSPQPNSAIGPASYLVPPEPGHF
jgi:hypothetical protein